MKAKLIAPDDVAPEYLAGMEAADAGRPEGSCPFGVCWLRQRCWWLAGYHDRLRESR